MLYVTSRMIPGIDFAFYGLSCAKDSSIWGIVKPNRFILKTITVIILDDPFFRIFVICVYFQI